MRISAGTTRGDGGGFRGGGGDDGETQKKEIKGMGSSAHTNRRGAKKGKISEGKKGSQGKMSRENHM